MTIQLGKLDKPMFQSWMEILLLTRETYLWLIQRPPEAGKRIRLVFNAALYCIVSYFGRRKRLLATIALLVKFNCFSLDRATHYAGGEEAQCFISA